jgi:hypothetical protein
LAGDLGVLGEGVEAWHEGVEDGEQVIEGWLGGGEGVEELREGDEGAGTEIAEGALALCRGEVFQNLFLVWLAAVLGEKAEERLCRGIGLDIGAPA